MLAAQFGHHAVVEQLVNKNAIIDRCDAVEGDSAVSVSVEHRHFAVLVYLMDKGANPDLRNPVSGVTSLGIAIKQGELQYVDALLNAGASPTMPVDKHGTTPLMLAVEVERPAVVQRIADAFGKIDTLPSQLVAKCQDLLTNPDNYTGQVNEPDSEPVSPEQINKASFPGQWVKLSSEQIRREYVDLAVRDLFSFPENTHVIHSKLSTVSRKALSHV